MYFKRNRLLIILIGLLFVLGILCIILKPSLVVQIIMYAIAATLIVASATFIATSRQYVGHDKTALIIQAVVLFVIALVILIFQFDIIRIILGAILLLFVIIQLIIAPNKVTQLKKDAWKYVIAIILILSIDLLIAIMVKVVGALLILLASYLLYILLKNQKNPRQPNILYELMLRYYFKQENKNRWEH